jgi:histidinol-phosphate aminotransferase
VLDEAYYAYANDSFLDDIKKYPNLVLPLDNSSG